MNKGIKIAVGSAAVISIGVIATHLIKKSSAASALRIDLDSVGVKEVIKEGGSIFGKLLKLTELPLGIIYTFTFQVTNPTDTALTLNNLSVDLSIKDKNGKLQRIGGSAPNGSMVKEFKPNSREQLKHDIEIRFTNVISILPNFITYAISRLRGAKSTQQVIADIKMDSMGLTIPMQTKINL